MHFTAKSTRRDTLKIKTESCEPKSSLKSCLSLFTYFDVIITYTIYIYHMQSI